jgi:FG-GAP repeat
VARRARRLLGGAIATAFAALLLPSIAGAATVKGDFDGDGFADLAIGVPGQTVEATPGWGAVHVIYGGPHGLSHRDSVIEIELPGTNSFGSALATGDFNGDGRADLAVGSPFSAFGGQADAGYVAVIYGTKHGLPLHRAQIVAQGNQGMVGTPEADDDFGHALAAANFGKSKADDLAIGVPGQSSEAGEVDVVYGSANGLRSKAGAAFDGSSVPALSSLGAGAELGYSLAAGNLGRSGRPDLAIGAPRAEASTLPEAGAAAVLFAGRHGVTTTGARLLNADTAGLASGAQASAAFGFAVAVGNFGHSRTDDLAVGAPFFGESSNVGQVTVFYGGANGPPTKHAQLLQLGTHGLPAPAPGGDAFGRELVAGDAGGGGRDDLVSSSERDVGTADSAGAVIAVYGSRKGLKGRGSQEIDRTTKGVAGDPIENAFFGASMSIGPYGGKGTRWVAVGVPGADAGTNASAGAVNLLRGGRHGLHGAGQLMEGAGGLSGAAEASDLFGAELSGPSSVGLFD